MKNIHIAYGDSAKGCLIEAMEKHGLSGDGVIPSRDDFTQGPISECLLPNGLKQRIEYWDTLNHALGFGFETRDFYEKSILLLEDLEAVEVTIWPGNSCHDILASGWLISYLNDKDLNWFIVNLAKVEKPDLPYGLPVVNLAMYTPEVILKLYHYRKPLDSVDVNYFTSVWKRVAKENSQYRIKKGDEVLSVGADYFDTYILSYIPSHFELTAQVIGRILRDGEHKISDTTLEWNIRKFIHRKVIEHHGDIHSVDTYLIRKTIDTKSIG